MIRITLRRLVLALAIISVLVTLANAFYAAYQVQRDELIQGTLEVNRVYAAKLANVTEAFFASAQKQLAYSASLLSENMAVSHVLESEAVRMQMQTDSFNSVVIVDKTGKVLAGAPIALGLQGRTLNSVGNEQALSEKRPLISDPFIAVTGNLLVNLSQPIFSPDGDYAGYIGGTIYLKSQSILGDLLGQHFYKDDSYLYVVDRQGRLIYHPDQGRVGEVVVGNPVIEAVILGESGARSVTNSRGVAMLAGYAPISASRWGVVAQRPTAVALMPLQGLMRSVVGYAVPIGAMTLVFIWLCARLISRPLWQLARNVEAPDPTTAISQVAAVRPWYFEVASLRRAVLVSLSQIQETLGILKKDSSTDHLTGLYNRRGLDDEIRRLAAKETPFSVLALDIDRFKEVNDKFGHPVGDLVLKALARVMLACSRSDDICCRSGGEEFLIVLPDVGIDEALGKAERLRLATKTTSMPAGVGQITISVGVAAWNGASDNVENVLAAADSALYFSKNGGRDQVSQARAI